MKKIARVKKVDAAIKLAAEFARLSTCKRARCGSVVVDQIHNIIGCGYNSPPRNEACNSRCERKHELKEGFKSDRTCCIHAEQRAIMDALRNWPDDLEGGRLYFIRVDESGQEKPSGQPYCTICSKMALDVGLKEFVLVQSGGVVAWNTKEYNDLSYEYPT